MKCSLLTLSTFIDGALSTGRAAEVDAHLVGCPRCTAGAATLREEKGRIRQLARVRVQPSSAQALLDQVGIIGARLGERPARVVPDAGSSPPTRPWLAGGGSAALPWTPRRPPPSPPIPREPTALTEERPVTSVSTDVQPDLPFDSAAAPAAGDASPGVGAVTGRPHEPATTASSRLGLDDDPVAPLEAWEAAVPPYVGAVPEPSWEPPTHAVARPEVPDLDRTPPSPPMMELAGPPPTPAGPPRRVQTGGARALLDRVRDLVAVPLALAHGDTAVEDTAQIVTGANVGPPLPPPVRGFELSGSAGVDAPATRAARRRRRATEQVEAESIAIDDDGAMELSGLTGVASALPARAWTQAEPEADVAPDEDDSWNAFGAAAFRDTSTAPGELPPAATTPARGLGRHSRAVRRQPPDRRGQTATALLATAGAALRSAGARTGAAVRARGASVGGLQRRGGSRPALPASPRVLAAIGAIGLIFVVALVVGHGRSPATNGSTTANRTAPSAAAHTGTAAPTTSAAPVAPPALTDVQTFGTGGTGFQVVRLRFGAYNGSQRVVFDVAAASTAAVGSPTVKLGFSDPTTLLVTFSATLPAGSLPAMPSGGVITSITRVPSTGGATVYRFALTRAARIAAFYLDSPVRFVLDVH